MSGCTAALLLFAACAYAQVTPPAQRIPRQDLSPVGSVEGIVKSSEGQALGGVHLVFKNNAGGQETNASSSGEGVILVPALAAGTYTIQATLDGFEPLTLAQFEVAVRSTSVLDLQMKPLAASTETPGLPQEKYAQEQTSSPYRTLTVRGPDTGITPAPTPTEPLPEEDKVFVKVPDRWKLPLPPFRRYDGTADMQYMKGHLWDPFNTNVLKGDKPILPHRIFLNLGFISDTFNAVQTVPLPTIPYRDNPNHYGFGQYAMTQTFAMTADLNQGDAAYRPVDWRIRVTTDVAVDFVNTGAPGLVWANPALGDSRFDRHTGFQEAFGEIKLKDLSNEYDTVSIRGGIQGFNSDFRGFIFVNQQPGIRIFGTADTNRYQYNVAVFDMLSKDPNSGLNTFKSRHQRVYVANLYRQDFIVPGYTVEVSFHYDKDDPSFDINRDGFQVRPEPIGPNVNKSERAYYYGFAGDGHWGRLNLTDAFYQVLGTDKYNALAERPEKINARMAALELSMDHNWFRYRTSFFYASGDRNPKGGTATGFDSITDNPNFAGGAFSYWDRVQLVASGAPVDLTNGNSLVPDLRTAKANGQANFVNPGLFLYNIGADADLTTRLKFFSNLNIIRFADTEPLELLLGMNSIHAGAGADSGIGAIYRPKNSSNIAITAGFNAFFPFAGFEQMFTGRTLFGFFTNVRFRF